MNTCLKLVVVSVCCIVTCFLTQGCGDDGDGDSSVVTNSVTVTNNATPSASATGNWNGFFGTGVGFSMTLVQTGDAITGSYSIQSTPGTVSGSTSGGNINLTVTAKPSTNNTVVSEWGGTINADMNSASGNYKIIQGGGGNGQWSMTR